MYKTFRAMISIIWVLDTTYKVNGIAWCFIWLLMPSAVITYRKYKCK